MSLYFVESRDGGALASRNIEVLRVLVKLIPFFTVYLIVLQ